MFVNALVLFFLTRKCTCTPDDGCRYKCLTATPTSGEDLYIISQTCEDDEPIVTSFHFDHFQKKRNPSDGKVNFQPIRIHTRECEDNRTTLEGFVKLRQQKPSPSIETIYIPTNQSSVNFADLKMDVFVGVDSAPKMWYTDGKSWVRERSPKLNLMVPDPSHHRFFCVAITGVFSFRTKTFVFSVVHLDAKGEDRTVALELDALLERLFLLKWSGALYKLAVKVNSKLHQIPTQFKLSSLVIDSHKRYVYTTMRGVSEVMLVLTYEGKVIASHEAQPDMVKMMAFDSYEKKVIYKTKTGFYEFNPRENRTIMLVFPAQEQLVEIQYEPKLIATLQENGKVSLYDRDWTSVADLLNPRALKKAIGLAMIPNE